jgi:DNA-binding transcriptional LysR family regulator
MHTEVMAVTLEQARALDAFERLGTFARAAKELHKGHTAVLYALRTLEEQTGLTLLDRRGYRTRLTPAGMRVLERCRKLLEAERALETLCLEIQSGWEPSLRIVFDGIFPVAPILRVVKLIAEDKAPTKMDVTAEFLAGVETTFLAEEADLMISVLPPASPQLRALALAPIRAVLVAQRTHPLARGRRERTADELASHVLLTVRGSDPRLQLSTMGLEQQSTVRLNDFASKKAGLLAGMGFGWMPEYLIADELRRGKLVRVRWKGESTHTFAPRLYHHAGRTLGRAASRVIDELRSGQAGEAA